MHIPDVPPPLLAALSQAAEGQRLALVGGVVRDLLLHRQHQDPWRGLPDLDLVVEGSAAVLVKCLPRALEQQLGQPVPMRQQHHGRYGTVAVELELPAMLGGVWLLDLASARQEVYRRPGENPQVSPGSLEDDLARRDLTVNAMALELKPPHADVSAEANLLDPHDGRGDLAKRQLRFLHCCSLEEDPTRLLRAARYGARLGFDLASEALDQCRFTLQEWPWDWRLGDDPAQAPPALATRLRMELELLLAREPWQVALGLLQQWGGLGLLDSHLQADQTWRRRLHWARRLQLPLLLAMVANAEDPIALACRLQLPAGQQRWLQQRAVLHALLERQRSTNTPSMWTSLFESPGLSPQAAALMAVAGGPWRRPLLRWWYGWRHVKPPLTAQQLMVAEGLQAGPALGQRLRALRYERLDQGT